MLAEQAGGCAICGAEPKTRRLHVDHDHKTGAVRGLLCYRCNRALPHYLGAEWLRDAIGYLTRGNQARRRTQERLAWLYEHPERRR